MSSMKKNTLAAALVAGLGLAGVAAAYEYGTLKDPANCAYTDCTAPFSEQTPSADLLAPEPVAFQNITVSSGYDYIMREQLVWDINPIDNAVNFTQGFTARMTIEDGALFDTSYTPTVYNSNCNADGIAGTADDLVPTTAYAGENIRLDPSLTCTWDVNFDNYYNGGQTISIRITPKQGVTNPQNPSNGVTLRYDSARLTSLDEFVNAPIGSVVNGTFWFVNPTNDAIFADSRKQRPILTKVSGVTACADEGASGELNKFIDVADNWLENQKPKTRFSFDGRLGSAIDASGGTSILDAQDYNSQDIDLGAVTLGTNDSVGGFTFQAGDTFRTVLTGDGGGWAAFDNDPAGSDTLFNDDLWLVNGNCADGTPIARGEVIGTTVQFAYTGATLAGIYGAGATAEGFTANMTVCGFVNTDTVINDQNISVATTFTRADIVGGPQTFAGETCTLMPLRYNGSTMEIFTINPADNDRQRSFIRLTNRSATPGWVRLEGIDDNGVAAPGGQVSVFLGANQSVQLTAAELENGGGPGQQAGAWGNGAGKWRAVVTAEFPGLVASSYVRNTIGDILSNITDADTRGEQYGNDYAEGTFASTPGERPSDFSQETTPDFRGNNSASSIPGGPNGSDGPAGGTTAECGNPGINGTALPNCPGTPL